MKSFLVRPASALRGSISLPGDKSIAHRAVILSSLSLAKVRIKNFPANQDCLITIKIFKGLGVEIHRYNPSSITICAKGLYGLKKPGQPLFVGNSGTTLRLLLGVLAGQPFTVTLVAARSLALRPMRRVTLPLRKMGAKINSKFNPLTKEEYPPITITGGTLKNISYRLPLASAQVKSAILLAGLYAEGKTRVVESTPTRDHTERMFKLFGADLKVQQNTIVITGNRELAPPRTIYIPGDISSASFFMVLAAILPDSKLTIKDVGLNPTRMGIVRVLKRMGADIVIADDRGSAAKFEPIGDIRVKTSRLRGITVTKKEIPSLIDELPILMVAACFVAGKTILQGVGELRVKETDRIKSMTQNLSKMGACIRSVKSEGSENIVIQGVKRLKGAVVASFGDHRTAMSMIVAGLSASGVTKIDEVECINKSFPEFLHILKGLIRTN